jgi:AICAR transformylase/IMP cyclohydrolase PurH
METNEIKLKYGCNPHQSKAKVFSKSGDLPFTILNGQPGGSIKDVDVIDAANNYGMVMAISEVRLFHH